jgi:hypothetical protein
MAGTLKATSVAVSFSASAGGGKAAGENTGGVTTISVSYIYESTAAIASDSDATDEILKVLNLVPNKPPNGKENFNLKSCNASQAAGNKPVITAAATFDDVTPPRNRNGGSGSDPGGGGGRGGCLPPDTETTSTIKAMKDYPIKNKCGTPILPTPQIEVTLLQRTKVEYHLGSDTAPDQNDLRDNVGSIDQNETDLQAQRTGHNAQSAENCPPDGGAPPMPNADGQIDEANRPCGSLLQGGSIGAIQQGPCGSYYAVTKNYIDGDFSAPGIFEAGYANCNNYGQATSAHTATGPDGKLIPIVAMKGIGGIIPWPGQPKRN